MQCGKAVAASQGYIAVRSPRRLFVAMLVATTALIAPEAMAADWTSGYSSGSGSGYSSGAQNASIIAIDTSVSATSHGSLFLDSSVTAALTGDLEQTSGWRGRLQGQIGTFHYTANDAKIVGTQGGGSGLIGYEWVDPDVHVAAYIGFNYQNIKLDPADPNNKTRGSGYGLRLVGEMYATPSTYTMASAYVTYSTLHNAYYTRFKAGYDIFDRTYVGPEFSMLGDQSYSQWRLGMHLTGLSFGRFKFGLAGGYLRDSRNGPGAYMLVDSRMAF